MKTDVTKPIGFRSTQPFGSSGDQLPWRVWVGHLTLARAPGIRFAWWSARATGWDSPPAYSLALFGLSLSWSTR